MTSGKALRKILGWSAACILAVILAVVMVHRFLFPAIPPPSKAPDVVFLDQGWNADQREKYYQTPQGSLIIPYSWYLALERPEFGNHEPFNTDENLMRYDLVPDSHSKFNPDHLPVGIAKQVIPDRYLADLGCGTPPCQPGSSLHKEWLTFTCAACHTSHLNYKGKVIQLDGSRGTWNFTVFNNTLANLILVTSVTPTMFDRFSEKVIQQEKRPDTPEEKTKIKHEMREFLESPVIVNAIVAGVKGTYPTEEGYGRMDALGRGSNGQFASLDKRNIVLANAPATIPPLWYTHDYDWVQSVAAISQPLGRNVTESWGVNSVVDLGNPDPKKLFTTSIGIKDMFWMETLISLLQAPKWPENILGPIDQEKVKLGKYLYEEKVFQNALSPAEEQWCPDPPASPGAAEYQPCPNPNTPVKGLCARCHAAAAQVNANQYGKRYWQLPMYKLSVIGTDPADAVNFNAREVYTGNLRSHFGGKEKVGIGEALLTATTGIMARQFEDLNIPPEQQVVMTGFRPNGFRAPLGYPARPLTGYWATPPYLHNGSVPNLYQLLSPASERSAAFWTGNREYDPVNVGYQIGEFEGGFEFLTRRTFFQALGASVMGLAGGHVEFNRDVAGNSNLGHEFRDAPRGTKGVIGPSLSPMEREAIIEYMKVMPELSPLDGKEEDRRKGLLKDMEGDYEGAGTRAQSGQPRGPA